MRLMRGRRRNSSGPRISNQRSLTGFTLVKKRWPPMSKRHPLRTAVRLIPPTTLSASRTVGATPRLVSMYAAVRPAGPAPMMTTSWSFVLSDVGVASLTGRLSGTGGAAGSVGPASRPAVYGHTSRSPGTGSGAREPGERQRRVPDETSRGDHVRAPFHLVTVGDHRQR